MPSQWQLLALAPPNLGWPSKLLRPSTTETHSVLKGKREHSGIASLLNLSQAVWQHNTYLTLHPV